MSDATSSPLLKVNCATCGKAWHAESYAKNCCDPLREFETGNDRVQFKCGSCGRFHSTSRDALNCEHGKSTDPHERQVGGTHYKDAKVQPWDVIDGWPIGQRVGFYRGNALKYIMRAGTKGVDMREDVEKSQHYIEKLLSVLNDVDQD